jgi:hypothetical protein
MKAIAGGKLTDRERLTALETRMDGLQPKVDDMHEILDAVRTIGRWIRRIIYYFGGPTAVIGLGLAAWKALHG